VCTTVEHTEKPHETTTKQEGSSTACDCSWAGVSWRSCIFPTQKLKSAPVNPQPAGTTSDHHDDVQKFVNLSTLGVTRTFGIGYQ
jgi:hypothetical protein